MLDMTLLEPQRYLLDLTRLPSAGQGELVGTYLFRLVVQ
jgi:hypothetical protein